MARYFFNVCLEGETLLDSEGIELSFCTLGPAEWASVIRDVVDEDNGNRTAALAEARVEVADEFGRVAAVVPFKTVRRRFEIVSMVVLGSIVGADLYTQKSEYLSTIVPDLFNVFT